MKKNLLAMTAVLAVVCVAAQGAPLLFDFEDLPTNQGNNTWATTADANGSGTTMISGASQLGIRILPNDGNPAPAAITSDGGAVTVSLSAAPETPALYNSPGYGFTWRTDFAGFDSESGLQWSSTQDAYNNWGYMITTYGDNYAHGAKLLTSHPTSFEAPKVGIQAMKGGGLVEVDYTLSANVWYTVEASFQSAGIIGTSVDSIGNNNELAGYPIHEGTLAIELFDVATGASLGSNSISNAQYIPNAQGDMFFFARGNGGVQSYQAQDNISLEHVPEPATMSLIALGGLALIRRRRK